MLPVSIFRAPSEGLASAWKESSRNRALMLGLPAFLVSLLGAAIFLYAQFGNRETVEDHYKYLFEKSKSDLILLIEDAQRRQAVQAGSGDTFVATEAQKQKAKKLQSSQEIFLDKLISLAPENPNYRYDLADLAGRKGEAEQRWTILAELAPEDRAGHARAHIELAKRDLSGKSVRQFHVIRAETHLEHALSDEPDNKTAKYLLATLRARKKNYDGASELFRELLDEDPVVFRKLVELNNLKGTPEENQLIIKSALEQYEELARTKEINEIDQRWFAVQRGIADTMMQLERYDDATEKISLQLKNSELKSSRVVFLRKLLAQIYYNWGRNIGGSSSGFSHEKDIQVRMVEKFKKAYELDKRNTGVLQGLAELNISKIPEVSEVAKSVYDPYADYSKAPAPVLNQLGTGAMLDRDYDSAILHYERAQAKSATNPVILNNLAYSYLVAEETNPLRALELIRKAISAVDRSQISNLSNYLHTQGTALKQLNRLNEAILSFEASIRFRPNHPDTLRSAIECYHGLGLDPPEAFVARLKNAMGSPGESPAPK